MAEMSATDDDDSGFFRYMYDYDSDGACSWDDTPVTFLRPDGDTEGKDVQWCLSNDFFQVEEGLWSGDWYYRHHPEEKRFHEQRLDRTQGIRTRAKQRRARVQARRTERNALEAQQEAALVSVLKGDMCRLLRSSPEEVEQIMSQRAHPGSPYGTQHRKDPEPEALPAAATTNPSTAKEKAAARHRRILERGRDRMGVASGRDKWGAAADGEGEETPSLTNAARLAAMRRRRFKKEAPDAAAASEEKPAEENKAGEDAAGEDAAGGAEEGAAVYPRGMEAQQEAALTPVLMYDISRQTRTSPEEVQQVLFQEDIFGVSYGTHHRSTNILNQCGECNRSNPKEMIKDKRHQKMHPTGSEEYEETRQQRLLEKIVRWADGDQGIVDRTRAAIKDGKGCIYKCPCCQLRFPTKECSQLHARHVAGKAHDRYRREAGLPKPTEITEMVLDYWWVSQCTCCHLTFQTEQLADFHLKNFPDNKHIEYRKENGMAQDWDLEDVRERYYCPAGCGKWYFSQEKVDTHIQTQSGKAHYRYRMENNID